MLLSIEDVVTKKIDGFVKLKAYFYILGGTNEKAFLSADNNGDFVKIILLPEKIISQVIEQDDTFGVLVGGKYAYYAMQSIIKGKIIIINNQQVFNEVDELILMEDGRSQTFTFNSL